MNRLVIPMALLVWLALVALYLYFAPQPAQVAMWGWIPLVVLFFLIMPPRRAVMAAFILGWLFLPIAEIKIGSLPAYRKEMAGSLGVIVAALFLDTQRLMKLRFSWIDIPMIVWCLCPFVTSISNGLGVYDGISAATYQILPWGLPYFIGRLYFTNLEAISELAVAIVMSGLIYVPLCLLEIRFSPQLHVWVYGYRQHEFGQAMRFGGYRPVVFMHHGLSLAIYMMGASFLGIIIWRCKVIQRIMGMPVGWAVLALTVTTIMCKSVNAVVLLAVGLAVIVLTRRFRTPALVICLLLAPPVYMGARILGIWDGQDLVRLTGGIVNEDRAGSLQFRINNEDILKAKAMGRPLLGWGGWGRSRVYDDDEKALTVSDSLWIIALGQEGLLGLTSVLGALLLPVIVFIRRVPVYAWSLPAVAPAAGICVMTILYLIDSTFNYGINPVLLLCLGGISSTVLTFQRRSPASARSSPSLMHVASIV